MALFRCGGGGAVTPTEVDSNNLSATKTYTWTVESGGVYLLTVASVYTSGLTYTNTMDFDTTGTIMLTVGPLAVANKNSNYIGNATVYNVVVKLGAGGTITMTAKYNVKYTYSIIKIG